MAVLFETSVGDFVVDLFPSRARCNCINFVKLCKAKYYNNVIFHRIVKDFIVQTGDPTGSGNGGQSVYNLINPKSSKFINGELNKKYQHKFGSVSMASAGKDRIGSQFFIVTSQKNFDSLKDYTIIGEIGEGMETIMRINDAFLDERKRPLQNIRIRHTILLEDPFPDPPGLNRIIPDKSPIIKYDHLDKDYVPDDIDLNKKDNRTAAQKDLDNRIEKAKANSVLLEMLRDIPDRDIKPDEKTLFVCKLNPATNDEDLRTIFEQFGPVVSCEVIRDYKTKDSLQYAFITFEKKTHCENAFLKMNNVLLDDRRIRVDFSQSVAKQWTNFQKGQNSQNSKNGKNGKNGAIGAIKRSFQKELRHENSVKKRK